MESNRITVADIVRENPSSAVVFKKHQIDFCCKGKVPLEIACEKAGIDIVSLIKEIENARSNPSGLMRYTNWSKEMLVNFIVENHHQYLKNILPQILQFSERVAQVHGPENKDLVELYYVLSKLSAELTDHIRKEEEVLFPEILKTGTLNGSAFDEYEAEHEDAGEALEKIRSLTNGFNPPEYACNTYRALFSLLEELESDMHQHVHLENNILFPKLRRQEA